MKVLFLSASNKEFDGRTRALLDVLKSFSEVIEITTTSGKPFSKDNEYLIDGTYKNFVRKSVEIGKKYKNIDIIFTDNRKATIPALKLHKCLKNAKLVYDARELYLKNETKGIKSRIGCYFEGKMIERADLVICANEERRSIMEKLFKHHCPILVFENFRKLKYADDVSKDVLDLKFRKLKLNKSVKIISTAGCEIERGAKELIIAAKNLSFINTLYLVGCKDNNERKEIEELIKENSIMNVELIPRLKQDELKYFISNCDIGIAMYHKKNSNNLYCSSGKIYEYAYEGLAVATTDNPPMKRVLDEYGIGAYAENIGAAIEKAYNNLTNFRVKAAEFAKEGTIEKKQIEFAKCLKQKMEELKSE